MKNIWKIALCFFVSLMGLTSCEAIEDIFDDETETESVNPIVGVWAYISNGSVGMTFHSDGSGSWGTDEFTWETTEDKLYLNFNNSPREENFRYKIEDNNKTLYLYIKGVVNPYYSFYRKN